MVQVELTKIIIDEKNHDQAVVLREKGALRQVPIVIGLMEATSIQMKISGISSPRPLTHDLLVSLIASLGGKVERLTIETLKEGIFFAKLHLSDQAGRLVHVDCRPSDGIAVAVRLNLPIFIEEKIFSQVATSDM